MRPGVLVAVLLAICLFGNIVGSNAMKAADVVEVGESEADGDGAQITRRDADNCGYFGESCDTTDEVDRCCKKFKCAKGQVEDNCAPRHIGPCREVGDECDRFNPLNDQCCEGLTCRARGDYHGACNKI